MAKATIQEKSNNTSTEKSNWVYACIILLYSIILYGNTLGNEYALDDSIVITHNQFTNKGFAGIGDILSHDSFTGFFGIKKNLVVGGRYRPLSLVSFAIEHEMFGASPFWGHLFNILYYAFGVFLLYLLIKHIPQKNISQTWYLNLPIIVSVLFLAHPIHTEVVANIKGRDELFSLIGCLSTLLLIIRYHELKKLWCLATATIIFFLALLSKENSITWLIVIPLFVYFFVNKDIKNNLIALLPLIGAAILFLWIRGEVIGPSAKTLPGELMNNPFLGASSSEKYGTILYTLGKYLALLIFPHPLTYDYYPYHIKLVTLINWKCLLSLLCYSILWLAALFTFKKKYVIAFSILYFLITLSIVSNIFFPVGSFMNERFVYIPSIGYCLIVGYGLYLLSISKYKPLKIGSFILLIIILTGYSFKTTNRNTAWKNDFVLFTTDVKTSRNSAKGNCTAGGKLIEAAEKSIDSLTRKLYLHQAISYLGHSLKIYPGYNDALLLMGNGQYELYKNVDSSYFYYRKILLNRPYYEIISQNLLLMLSNDTNINQKQRILEDYIHFNPESYDANYQLGVIFGKHRNEMVTAIQYLERAHQINKNGIDAIKDLGVAYGIIGNLQKSLEYLHLAYTLDPKDPQVQINIGVTYQKAGDLSKAREFFEKARVYKN